MGTMDRHRLRRLAMTKVFKIDSDAPS